MVRYFLRYRQRILGNYTSDDMREMMEAGPLPDGHTVSVDRQNWVPVDEWEYLATDVGDEQLPFPEQIPSKQAQPEAKKKDLTSPQRKTRVICECGKIINAPAEYQNQRVKCPACGLGVLIVDNFVSTTFSPPTSFISSQNPETVAYDDDQIGTEPSKILEQTNATLGMSASKNMSAENATASPNPIVSSSAKTGAAPSIMLPKI